MMQGMAINDRQKQVLKAVVEGYVKSHEPIGSGQVVEMLPFEISSATVRNDMVELTEAGYISQPHTSAGRVPTEAGYREYIQTTMAEQRELSTRQQEVLMAHFKKLKTLQEKFREAARVLAELSGSVSLLVDEADQVYMSGLSKLPQLPEFRDVDFGEDFMSLLEDPAAQMKKLAQGGGLDVPQILLGADNPVSGKGSIVITRFGADGGKIISIVGPVRMHYGKALPALEYIKKMLEE